MTKYILAIDQGTTSSRAMILQQNGTPVCQAQHEITQYYPQPGFVEHDAEEIWRVTHQCCLEVIKISGLNLKEIVAIGITNQRETTVIWDKKTGRPISRAIVWQDRRTADLCETLAKLPTAKIVPEKTGLVIDPYLSATKISWILKNIPDAAKKVEQGALLFGTIDSFLLWHLTGGQTHATDATNASRTLLFNIRTQTWDEELLAFFSIPRNLLPEVKDNCADFGVTKKHLLGREIPITAMIGDQQAALVGQNCLQPGMMKSTYGTGCFLLLNTGDKIINSTNKLLSTVAYRINNQTTYGLEGSIFNAGTTVKWLRDNLHLIQDASEIEALASSVDSTEGVYFVSAFTGLGAPYWDPNARAAIIGLTRNTQIAHIARAALETVCYRTCDLIEAMEKDGVDKIKLIRVDGGMTANNWLLQYLADITSANIQRPKYVESTAVGAGLLAALGAGLYSSVTDLNACWHGEHNFNPTMKESTRAALLANWKLAVSRVRTQ